MSAELTQQMREMLNDLRKKVDKAKPVIAQVEKGELKVLNEAQRRQVDMFPIWKKNIEHLQNGEMPPKTVSAAESSFVAAADEEPEESATVAATHDNSNKNVTPARATAGRNAAKMTPKNAKGTPNAGGKGTRSAASPSTHLLPDGEPIPDDVIKLVKKLLTLPKKVQTALIDLYVKRQTDISKMTAITKEYDDLCKLRREIMTGKIETPNRVQEARLKLIDVVKREMNLETEKLKAQGERIKITIQIEMAEQIAAMSPQQRLEVDEEEEEAVEEATPVAETAATEEEKQSENIEATVDDTQAVDAEPHQAAEPDNEPEKEEEPEKPIVLSKAAVAPPPVMSSSDDSSSEDDEDAAPPPPADDDDDGGFMFGGAMFDEDAAAKADKKAKKAAKAAAKAKASAEEAEKEQLQKEEVDVENDGQDQEEGAEEQQPEVPTAPKEIDWTELKVIRNRVALEQKVVTEEDRQRLLASAGPANGATSSGRGRSSSNVRSPNATTPSNPFQISAITIDEDEVAKMLLAAKSKDSSTSKSSTAASKSSPKGGKGKASPVVEAPPATSAISSIHAGVVARVQRDLVLCLHNPLPNVKFVPSNESQLLWHVNVSPLEGPLLGVIVPLEIRFTELYPQDPPVVRCRVDVPHPSIANSGTQRDVLCFEHTRDNQWSPSFGVFSILSQLQTFFNSDNFARLKSVLGGSFKQRIAIARAECSRYTNLAIGHLPSHPFPPLPVYNGPFEKPTIKTTATGELQGPGSATWTHSYAKSGTHIFKLHLLSDSPRLVVGIAAPNGATGERVGNDEYGWGFSTAAEAKEGELRHKGRPVDIRYRGAGRDEESEESDDDHSISANKSESPTSTAANSPSHSAAEISNTHNSSLGGEIGDSVAEVKGSGNIFKAGDVIQFTINFSRRIFSVLLISGLTGAATSLYHGVPIPQDLEALVPTIQLSDRSKVLLELNIHTKSLLEFNTLRAQQAVSPQTVAAAAARAASPSAGRLVSPKSPTDTASGSAAQTTSANNDEAAKEEASQNAVEAARKPVRCVITLATPEEAAPMGVVVSVGRDPTTFMPSTISFRDAEYVSAKSFPQYKPTRAAVGRRREAFIALALNKKNATENLAAIKNSITLLCRNPDAATTYTPPFKAANVWPSLTKALQSIIDEPAEDRLLVNRYESFIQMVHLLAALDNLAPEVSTALKTALNNALGSVTDANIAGIIAAVAAVTPLTKDGNEQFSSQVNSLLVQTSTNKKATKASEVFAALPKPKRHSIISAILFSVSVREDASSASSSESQSVFDGLNVLEGTFTDANFAKMAKLMSKVSTWDDIEKLMSQK